MLVKILEQPWLCRLASIVCIFALVGCTSVGTYTGGTDDVPARIRAEQLISNGDNVQIRTLDGSEYRFNVRQVDDETVQGANDSVRIDDIVFLKVTTPEWGKTFIPPIVIIAVFAFLVASAASNISVGGN